MLETLRDVVRETVHSHSLRHTLRMGLYGGLRPVHAVTRGHDGVDLFEREWDNLVVLDACRADLFEETVDTGAFDDYERVTSRGSMTAEWVRRYFDGDHGDVVYVTANPHVAVEAGDSFHALREVYADDDAVEDGTVPPGPVAEAAREAAREYPEKRRVVHFMQPHHPFLDAPELEAYSNWGIDDVFDGGVAEGIDDPFVALEAGAVDRDRLWDAYRRNLVCVADDALDLAASLPGRTVITSDHGNLVGERLEPLPVRGYGHPPGVRHPALTEVPWAVVADDRIDVSEGAVRSRAETDGQTRQERLEALGYA